MNIALDISPLKSGHHLQHRVRGTGFYINNLVSSLKKYFPENNYLLFNQKKSLKEKVDLIHYPYFEPFFLTLPVFPENKIVVTVHDLTPFVFPKEFPSGLKGNLKWQIQKFALKKAAAIIADSQSSKRDIVKYAGIDESKIHVVYLAAAPEFVEIKNSELKVQNIRKKYNLPEKFVLYVGDATWNKNIPRLMEAVIKTNIPLVMVGKALADKDYDRNNPWNKDLVTINKLAFDNKRIIRLGFVPTEDLVSIYNIAAVFCMPSLYEGFGLPILEAMGCGCPVVSSKSGSIPEIGGDAPFYVDPYKVSSIAEGLNKVFSDEILRKTLSKNGLEQGKKFTWEKTARETVGVYKAILR